MDKSFVDRLDEAMGNKPGMRAGVILGAEPETKVVKVLGYGTYDGNHPCPHIGGMLNPRITLDSGEQVWGCECWWGTEEKIKQEIIRYQIAGYTVEAVDVAKERSR